MKHLCIVSAMILAALLLGRSLFAESAPDLPKIDHLQDITFRDYNGWSLTIVPDGSAAIQFGSGSEDNAVVPKHTFSFGSIYNTLSKTLSKHYIQEKSIAVFINLKGPSGGSALYIHNKGMYNHLMAIAQDRAAASEGRFKEMLRTNPPVPRDTLQ